MEMCEGKVVRVSYNEGARRELLIALQTAPTREAPRLFELSLERDVKEGCSQQLRLTAPGDNVTLWVTKSSNGVDGLQRFENLSLRFALGR